MRHMIVLLLLTIFANVGLADNPKPSVVRLPKILEPVPVPKPPSVASKLDANMMYVIEADTECFIKQFDPKLLNIIVDEGPIKIRGQFVDGTGKVETRLYKSKFVYTLTASGTGTAYVVIAPKNVEKADDVVTLMLDVTDGTAPQPPPTPTPTPTPTPGKSPFVGTGFRVLIIYPNQPETKLPASQQLIISGQKTRDFLENNCVLGDDGKTKEYRIWREDEKVQNAPKIWQDAFARKKDSVPWLMVGNGTDGFEGPLPTNDDDLLKLLQKYTK